MKFIRNLLNLKRLVSIEVSSRDLVTIKRYIARGFKVIFRGAVAVLEAWV
jgi:hypothetical protein